MNIGWTVRRTARHRANVSIVMPLLLTLATFGLVRFASASSATFEIKDAAGSLTAVVTMTKDAIPAPLTPDWTTTNEVTPASLTANWTTTNEVTPASLTANWRSEGGWYPTLYAPTTHSLTPGTVTVESWKRRTSPGPSCSGTNRPVPPALPLVVDRIVDEAFIVFLVGLAEIELVVPLKTWRVAVGTENNPSSMASPLKYFVCRHGPPRATVERIREKQNRLRDK